MPYLSIQTNISINKADTSPLLRKASQLTAEQLGKPESYVMVSLRPPVPMLFAGSDAPAAYLELKSIGLPDDKTRPLSQALCQLIQQELGIEKDRIYIEFSSADRNMWGWDGATF